ncbi:MAG: peptide ABC transporter substrate-binding protein [Opitutus sp.]|nr:peptide ABC transporter substrate-binding protein [Opitutus sp.]
MRRFAFSFAAVLLFAACGRQETFVDAGRRTQTLHVLVNRDPGSLDPHLAGGEIVQIINALFEGLVNLANDGATVLPGVAERWDISADGKTYTFHLRADARWSNGDAVTALDFLGSFLRFLDPRLRSPFVNDLFMIAGAQDYAEGRNPDAASVGLRVADARTLVITLAHRSPYFLLRLSEREVRPVHLASVDRFGGRQQRGAAWDKPGNLVCNGPFQLTEWRPNAELVLAKNPHYWNAARVRLNAIRFHPIDDSATGERAYRTGQLHISAVPAAKRAAYRDQKSPDLHTVTGLATRYLRFRTTNAPFTDARVRRALSLAIDRGSLVTNVLAGFGAAARSLTVPGTGGYQPPDLIRFDPAAARQLLAEAGFAGGAGFPPVEILLPNKDGETVAIAEALQQMWRKELGVQIKIVSNDGVVFLETLRSGNFQLSLNNWGYDINDPVDQYLLALSTYPSNQSGWSDAAYDRAFARSEEAATDAERRVAFDEMETLLAAEMPFVPLFHPQKTALVHPSVQGWRDNGLANIDWRELWLAAPK